MLRTFFKKIFLFELKVVRQLRRSRIYFLKKVYDGRLKFEHAPDLGKGCNIQLDWSNASVQLGKNLQLRNDCYIRAEQNGVVDIGDNVFFNNGCSINCLCGISIGSHCQFGEGVKIYDHNHQYKVAEVLIAKQGYSKANIQIGNNCWIGSNVVILKGVHVGDNVVIGAGCVIYKDVEANTVVIGNQ